MQAGHELREEEHVHLLLYDVGPRHAAAIEAQALWPHG